MTLADLIDLEAQLARDRDADPTAVEARDRALLPRMPAYAWGVSLVAPFVLLLIFLRVLSDKLVMSAVLPLDVFGLYSLAFAVASTVHRLSTPFSTAYFPHFVELVEKRSRDLLWQSYFLASRLASAVVICAGLVILIYARPIMLLLTGQPGDAGTIAPIFAMLVAASNSHDLACCARAIASARSK